MAEDKGFYEFCGESLLFDSDKLLNNSWPEFTPCFQNSLLVWVPCGLVWLLLPLYLVYLFHYTSGIIIPVNKLNLTKTFFSLILCLLSVIDVIKSEADSRSTSDEIPDVVYVSGALKATTYFLAAIVIQVERIKGVISSALMWTFWLLSVIGNIIPFYTKIILKDYDNHLFPFVVFYIYYGCLIIQLVLSSFAETIQRNGYSYLGEKSSPEVSASVPNRLIYWWMNGIVFRGYRKTLEEDDLFDLHPRDKGERVVPQFENMWDAELTRARAKKKLSDKTLRAVNGYASFHREGINKQEMASVDVSEHSPLLLKGKKPTSKAETKEDKEDELPASLSKVLAKTYGFELFQAHLCKFIYDLLQFVSPLLLNILIDYTRNIRVNEERHQEWKGYVYASAFFVVALLGSILFNLNFHIGMTLGMRIKSAIIAAVYKKSLTISNEAKKESTVGEIVNLMSVDCQRLQDVTGYLWVMWSAPLQIFLALFMLWGEMGVATLAGLAIMILLMPINALIAMKQRKYQITGMKFKDQRIKLMSEVLNGIKVLKLYAWETSFQEKVEEIRHKELVILKKTAYLSAGATFIWTCAPYLVTLATFATYVLVSESHYLDAGKAFVALSLFNILRFPINLLPMMVSLVVQANVSLKRIGKFLKQEDLDKTSVIYDPMHGHHRKISSQCMNSILVRDDLDATLKYSGKIYQFYMEVDDSGYDLRGFTVNHIVRINHFPFNHGATHVQEFAVQIQDGTFTWDRSNPIPTLNKINLDIPVGQLIAVVGQVGVGKSSLISAMLGEMEKLQGTVTVKSSIAYVPQQAWIQNATLKDNILFGKDEKSNVYDHVLEACALKPDLEILPGGDMTEIGEKGINLSGGQKQRVSLARAVYSDADIYLLDDPLSAVDSHVGKHIFSKVVSNTGLLRRKTRILVTHGVHWLPQVDKIVVLIDGHITEMGSYDELLSHDGVFAQFLKTYLTMEDSEEEDEDPENGWRNRLAFFESKLEADCDTEAGPTVGMTTNVHRILVNATEFVHCCEILHQEGDYSMVSNLGEETGVLMEQPPHQEVVAMKAKILERVDSVTSDAAATSGDEKTRSRPSSHLSRQISKSVIEKKEESKTEIKPTKPGDRLTEEEKSETGKVKMAVFMDYFRAIGLCATFSFFLFFALYQAVNVYSSIWLSDWTEDSLLRNTSLSNTSAYRDKNDLYLGVYGGLGIAQAVLIFLYAIVAFIQMVRASKLLHTGMLANVLRSPMMFFDTTPSGRIVNRFSRDVETIDNTLPQQLRSWMNTFFGALSTLVIISYSTPIFMAVILPLGVFYYLVQRFYIPTSRQLKRIESTTRSPIYTHFSETITGATSIRAYKATDQFILQSQNKVDKNQVYYFSGIASNRWLAVRLEFLGSFIVLAAAMFAVVAEDSNESLVGLSVSYALQVTGALNWMVRMTSDLETNIVSVERVKEYTQTPTEAAWVNPFKHPPNDWPQTGTINFINYTTRYRPGLDLVLKGLNCQIKGGEKIGIVGRTGAGKSSMTVALFRLIEAASGSIVIDNVVISDIGLHELRSKITILPQDPVLFSGTLRMNLDPFDIYPDDLLWRVLEHANLKTFVEEANGQLNYECGEGGQNLSVGQRQLVCLARSLLRKTKILVLDEATAAVDMETDDLIQKTIRTEFKECTVLTIAHRLNTIMDYDRIMVLDQGLIKEFDTPAALLGNKESIFYGMAKDANLV